MAGKLTLAEVGDNLLTLSKGKLLRELHKVALRYSARAETRAKGEASMVLTPRTGHLAGSIAGKVVKREGYIGINLSAGGGRKNVKYAKVHEQQGVPGTFFTIKAKNAPYLRFQYGKGATTPVGVARGGKTGAKWASVKEVRIPSRPFLKPSMDWLEKQIVPEVGKVLKGEAKI